MSERGHSGVTNAIRLYETELALAAAKWIQPHPSRFRSMVDTAMRNHHGEEGEFAERMAVLMRDAASLALFPSFADWIDAHSVPYEQWLAARAEP